MQAKPETQSAPPVRPIVVDVYAKQEGGEVVFTHEWKFDGDPSPHQGTIDVPPGSAGTPPVRMQFHLHDDSGLHLKFMNPASEAMWVSQTNTCPDQPGDGGQISFNHPSTAHLLQVDDANSGPACTLYYTLRFDGDASTDPDGDKHPPYIYDPEIRNGGTTIPVIDKSPSPVLVAAAAAAVLALIAAILWLT